MGNAIVLLKPLIVLLVLIFLMFLNSFFFKRNRFNNINSDIIRNSISFFLILLAILAFIVLLPIDKSLKGQILSLTGIIVSAGIALSSTTFLGNLIAGIMNNTMSRFRNGDFIKIGEFQGRIIKKNLFHVEIQTEESNFITLPNLYVANNPVKMIEKSNTVVSALVSLGYDVPRVLIEKKLKEAALEIGLRDPYVYITSLGDFSISYKIHGFLDDAEKIFSTQSLLNCHLIDKLHESKIEIVSPSFMNQRRVDEQIFIPKYSFREEKEEQDVAPEDLIFDEAVKSEKLEQKKDYLRQLKETQETLKSKLKELKDKEDEKYIKKDIEKNNKIIEEVKESIEKEINSK